MDYIQGEKFKSLANNVNVFYRHTHDVDYFFKYETPKIPFILISHNSDGNVCQKAIRPFDASFELAPDNLVKWFTQNVNHKHPKIQSLPIGLENSEWFIETKKIEKLKNIIQTPKKIINFVYMNHNIKNNSIERQPLYDLLSNKPYVTSHYGHNGLNFDSYLTNLYNHHFMICPPGNGIGVHQPWEAMYINTIPIQKRYIDTSYYFDLPICFVDDWAELENIDFLISEYKRIMSTQWNLDKLYFKYWKELIESEINQL